MTARSYLYVPGNAPEKLAKACDRGADALIVDLEDAVPHAGKEATRAAVADWLAGQRRTPGGAEGSSGPEIWVRVNPGAAGHADARAVVGSALTGDARAVIGSALTGDASAVVGSALTGDASAVVGLALTGLCVAKAESAAELEALAVLLDDAEAAAGLGPGTIALMPLLESGAAVFEARTIARAPRVTRLQLGEVDLAADLGITPGPDGMELLWARSQVVAASAAAGIAPPVAPVSVETRDLEAFRRSTEALARLGFVGRACVHPAQLPVAHEVFTPTKEALDAARSLLDRYERALATGTAVCLDEAGRLVDEAVVRSARRVVGMVGMAG